MRNQKRLTILTGGMTLISILLYVFQQIIFCWCKWLGDVSLAVFGSAMVGLFMSLSSYFSAKQQEVQEFIRDVENHVDNFRWLAPLQIKIPRELYKAYLKSGKEIIPDSLYEALETKKMLREGTTRALTGEELLMEWTRQTVYDSYTEQNIKEEMKDRLRDAEEQIDDAIKKYRNLPNTDIKSLLEKQEKLDFFNEKQRNTVNTILNELLSITKFLNGFSNRLRFLSPYTKLYQKLILLEKAEKELYSLKEWKPYQYEDREGMFTYQVRNINNKYFWEIEKNILFLEGRNKGTNDPSISWEEYIISPLVDA